MEDYIVVHFNERGKAYLELLDEEVLLEQLNENWWGDVRIIESLPLSEQECEKLSNALLIVNGNIVIPKAKTVITEYVLSNSNTGLSALGRPAERPESSEPSESSEP